MGGLTKDRGNEGIDLSAAEAGFESYFGLESPGLRLGLASLRTLERAGRELFNFAQGSLWHNRRSKNVPKK